MDILEQYEKESPEILQGQPEDNYVSENFEINQWLMHHSGGLIKNKKQASRVLAGFIIVMVFTSLFLVLNRNKFSLTPEEEKLFRGKTAQEKLLIPQQRDQYLFNK